MEILLYCTKISPLSTLFYFLYIYNDATGNMRKWVFSVAYTVTVSFFHTCLAILDFLYLPQNSRN